MPKALWNGQQIAASPTTVKVEGNHYFPLSSLDRRFFRDAAQTTVCGWKGTANYFDVVVDGAVNPGAAWIYRDPKPAAAEIKDHVAFWRGVQVVD